MKKKNVLKQGRLCMRKKSILSSLLFAAALAVSVPVSAQEQLDFNSVTIEEHNKKGDNIFSSEDFNKSDESERGIFDIGSTDEVTIAGDGLYDIRSSLLSFQVYPPFGWLCVTQDFALQFDTFNPIYRDPLEAAKEMVADGMHLFLIDYSFEHSIEVYFGEDSIEKIIKNSADLNEEDENMAVSILNKMYFPGSDVSPVSLGSNRFYHFSDSTGVRHAYETYVNGICVDVIVQSIDGTACEKIVLEDVESMLSEMNFM